jgi:diacylglycerol kinase (ATP)
VKPGKTGIARIIAASDNSWQGMKACWKHEAAFRQNVALAVVLLGFSFFAAENTLQWLLLVQPLLLLIIVESLNSAIEAVVDRIGSEYHELSGRAKDIGSAAVLFCHCVIGVSWGAILWTNYA